MQRSSSALNWGLAPLLVIAFAITLTLQLEYAEDETDQSTPPDHADYFIRGAKMSALGLNGKLLYQIQAEEILHFRDRSANLTDMTLHYQGGSAGIWQMQANKGFMPAGGKKFELVGDVIIKGQRPNKGLTQMRMSEVELVPEEGMLRTASEVSITEPGSKISAVGMEADILNDVISLSNNVQVRYAW